MTIEIERWENKRMGDREGLEETGQAAVEAVCRLSDRAFFEGYTIVRGFEATVRVATPQHLQVAAGFLFQGGTPNLPIDLESPAFAHILAGSHGGNNSLEFGNGQAADGTNPRYVVVTVRHLSQQTAPKQKRFVDDTVQPKTYPLQTTNTRYNLAAFDGKVVHGAAAVTPSLPDPASYDGYVVISVVYVPPNKTSLSDVGVLIFDTATSTPAGAAGPWQPPGQPAFTPPWPLDVRSAPLDQRVTSIAGGNGTLINGAKGAVNGPATVTTDIISNGGLKYVNEQLGVDYAQVMPAGAQLGMELVWKPSGSVHSDNFNGGGAADWSDLDNVVRSTFNVSKNGNDVPKFVVLKIVFTCWGDGAEEVTGGLPTDNNPLTSLGLVTLARSTTWCFVPCDANGHYDLTASGSASVGGAYCHVYQMGYLK